MFRKVRSEKGPREIEKNEMEIMLTLYIEILVSRRIESCQELKFTRRSYRGAIERYPHQCDLNGSRSYRASIEHTKTSSMDRKVVEKLLRLILENLDGSKL